MSTNSKFVNFIVKIIIFYRKVKSICSISYIKNVDKEKYLTKLPYLYFAIFLLMIGTFINYATIKARVTKIKVDKYNLFAAQPLELETTTTFLYGMDSRAKKIDGVFKAYNCPMTGTGEYIVEQADKNGIPYWLVASIAFQESICGKYTPEKAGVESYNSWGWAVYGDSTKFFKSYEHGIKVVSEYLGNRFFKRGITDTCDIMKVYTPPSNGSWCRGVNYFGEKIQNYGSR
jgi:hypothetical protein